VALQDRLLVKGGHRQLSGRGRAASVGFTDAAAVLLAVAATPLSGPAISETAVNYQRYARLQARTNVFEPDTYSELHDLTRLVKGHSLSAFIAALLKKIAVGRFAKVEDIWRRDSSLVSTRFDPKHDRIAVKIELMFPTPGARVTIEAYQADPISVPTKDPLDPVTYDREELLHRTSLEYHITGDDVVEYHESLPRFGGIQGMRVAPDLHQVRTFSLATLHPLGSLFIDSFE
jgi:hypothetical protein